MDSNTVPQAKAKALSSLLYQVRTGAARARSSATHRKFPLQRLTRHFLSQPVDNDAARHGTESTAENRS